MVLDPGVERSVPQGVSRTGSPQILYMTKQYMFYMFPTLREYTFFSPVHHSYSRQLFIYIQEIYYFLVSSSLISEISDTKIHPITIGDHAPVSITLKNNS